MKVRLAISILPEEYERALGSRAAGREFLTVASAAVVRRPDGRRSVIEEDARSLGVVVKSPFLVATGDRISRSAYRLSQKPRTQARRARRRPSRVSGGRAGRHPFRARSAFSGFGLSTAAPVRDLQRRSDKPAPAVKPATRVPSRLQSAQR